METFLRICAGVSTPIGVTGLFLGLAFLIIRNALSKIPVVTKADGSKLLRFFIKNVFGPGAWLLSGLAVLGLIGYLARNGSIRINYKSFNKTITYVQTTNADSILLPMSKNDPAYQTMLEYMKQKTASSMDHLSNMFLYGFSIIGISGWKSRVTVNDPRAIFEFESPNVEFDSLHNNLKITATGIKQVSGDFMIDRDEPSLKFKTLGLAMYIPVSTNVPKPGPIATDLDGVGFDSVIIDPSASNPVIAIGFLPFTNAYFNIPTIVHGLWDSQKEPEMKKWIGEPLIAEAITPKRLREFYPSGYVVFKYMGSNTFQLWRSESFPREYDKQTFTVEALNANYMQIRLGASTNFPGHDLSIRFPRTTGLICETNFNNLLIGCRIFTNSGDKLIGCVGFRRPKPLAQIQNL